MQNTSADRTLSVFTDSYKAMQLDQLAPLPNKNTTKVNIFHGAFVCC